MTAVPGAGERTVHALLDCWHRLDLDGAVACMAEDATFVPDPKAAPTIGHDAIRTLWSGYMDAIRSYACEVRAIAADAGVVMVERVERIETARGVMTLPIVGVFNVDGAGRIVAWRDYWDSAMAPA